MPGFELIIAGEGPERARLTGLIATYGLGDRVRPAGTAPAPGAAGACTARPDASVLASSREGWANVLLESMACGTPVIAADVWGNPEVVRSTAGRDDLRAEHTGRHRDRGPPAVRLPAGPRCYEGLRGTVQLG